MNQSQFFSTAHSASATYTHAEAATTSSVEFDESYPLLLKVYGCEILHHSNPHTLNAQVDNLNDHLDGEAYKLSVCEFRQSCDDRAFSKLCAGVENNIKMHRSAEIIRNAWLKCYWSPHTAIGRKRLEKTWGDLLD